MTDAACVVADEPTDAEDATDAPGETTEAIDEPTEAHGEATDAATDDAETVDTSHLDDLADGCGCAEVWEHLSEQRGESHTE